MRIAHINVVAGLSTGRIAVTLCRMAMAQGHRALLCHSRDFAPSDVPSYYIGTKTKAGKAGAPMRVLGENGVKLRSAIHIAWARLADRAGFMSRIDTQRLVKQLEAFKPDMLHLHNLHGYYLHLPTLFNYIKRRNIPVVWTLHDCWAFTGHCAYYTMAQNAPPLPGDKRRSRPMGCERWLGGCGRCPLKRNYPASWLLDQSARNWREKRELFLGVKYMVLTAPSEWLADEARRSFLRDYPIYALPNGIDISVFKPCENQQYMLDVIVHSKLKELGGRHMILSVASVWEPRKGLDDLIELSEALGKDYLVVAVGVDEYQMKALPSETMLGLGRAGNINDLCALYTAAELYVSASHEETMGMTLVEALACGTQVLCYNATAMPEIVTDAVGEVVPVGDIEALADAARRMCASPRDARDCRARAVEFDANRRFAAYMQLYERMYRHSPAYLRDMDEAERRRAELAARADEGIAPRDVE